MIAPGLLDRRVAIYTMQDSGAYGFARPTLVWQGEFWARIDDTADTLTVPLSPQQHVESRVTARATVADYVDIPPRGMLREVNSEDLYFVRGVVYQRALRCKRVDLERVEPTQAASFIGFDSQPVTDGWHRLEDDSAFSSGFDAGFD